MARIQLGWDHEIYHMMVKPGADWMITDHVGNSGATEMFSCGVAGVYPLSTLYL
jgi:hypothetical protein